MNGSVRACPCDRFKNQHCQYLCGRSSIKCNESAGGWSHLSAQFGSLAASLLSSPHTNVLFRPVAPVIQRIYIDWLILQTTNWLRFKNIWRGSASEIPLMLHHSSYSFHISPAPSKLLASIVTFWITAVVFLSFLIDLARLSELCGSSWLYPIQTQIIYTTILMVFFPTYLWPTVATPVLASGLRRHLQLIQVVPYSGSQK